jgi:luciferase family oxidoreductase group 1
MKLNQEIPYSLLELATVGEGISIKQTFDNSLDLAQKAEEYGYKRFWLAEHHNSISIASSATAVLIGYIAGGTKKIRVGSGGIMLPNHSPLIVAEQFGTLGSLYPNRIDLGLGRAPGTDQLTAHAIRSDRMQSVYRFPEEIEKIQAYFSKENNQSKVRANVAEGVEMPIYVLGSSTDSAHLAASKGLPYVFASHFATTHLFEALKIYRDEFQASEVLKEPYAIAAVNVMLADTTEEAEDISTSSIRMMLGVMTGNMGYLQPAIRMNQELREVKAHPAMQQMLKYSFVGDKKRVQAQTVDFLEKTGVNELMVVSHIYDHEHRLRSFLLFSEIMKSI